MAHWLLLPEEKVMNNYRKSSINHPLGLFTLNTFNGGGGGGGGGRTYLRGGVLNL